MGAKGLHAPRCLYQHFFSPSPFPGLGAITKKYRNRFNSYHTLKTIYNSQIPVFSRNTLPGVHLLPSALLLPASVVAKGFILCILPDRPLQPGVPRAIIGSGCERHNPRGAIHIIDITDLYIFYINFPTDGSVLRKEFLFLICTRVWCWQAGALLCPEKKKSSSGKRGAGERKPHHKER